MSRELVERAVSGDREAYSELVRLRIDQLYGIARLILRDTAQAEDATQETYLRVQRHLAEVEGVDDVGAWILRIATNYCLNELRNRALARDRSQKLEELARKAP